MERDVLNTQHIKDKTNLKNLDFAIERMLNNDEFSNNTLNDIYNNFLSANKLIENNFDKFIEKTNY